MAVFHFTTTDADEGVRLDAYLAKHVPHLSRSFIADRCQMLIGDRTAKPSHRLSPNESITLTVPRLTDISVQPESLPLTILYEDEHLLALSKPSGQVVHPTDHGGHVTGTIVNALLAHLGHGAVVVRRQRTSNADASLRPGIVHRLDAGTSGVLLVAKTESAKTSLTQQFKDRTTEKHYLALVHGAPPAPAGRIDAPLARIDGILRGISTSPDAKQAITDYEVTERFTAASLLTVRILTGRTHQIRVHMKSLSCPIVGDDLYGFPKADARLKAPRLMLHAERLTITHPATSERLTFTAPLPADFTAYLATLPTAKGI